MVHPVGSYCTNMKFTDACKLSSTFLKMSNEREPNAKWVAHPCFMPLHFHTSQ